MAEYKSSCDPSPLCICKSYDYCAGLWFVVHSPSDEIHMIVLHGTQQSKEEQRVEWTEWSENSDCNSPVQTLCEGTRGSLGIPGLQ